MILEKENIDIQLNDFARQPTPDEWAFFGFVVTTRLLGKTVEHALCAYKDAHNVKETEDGLRTKFYKLAALRRLQRTKI